MAARVILPATPEVLELRYLLGNAENLHGKVDSVKARTDNLPVDTASVLSTIDTEVGALQSDVTSIKVKTDNLPADTAAALSAIQSDTDNIDSNVGTAVSLGGGTATVAGMLQSVAGTGFTASDSLKSIKDTILAIQNNTSFTASVVPIFEKPEAGSVDYQALVNIYDGNGVLVDPTFNEVFVKVLNASGASQNANLFLAAGQTTPAPKAAFYAISAPVVAPEAGAIYTDSALTSLEVIGVVSDTVIMSWSGSTVPVTGTLTKVSGTGDATLTGVDVDTSYVRLSPENPGQYNIFYNVTAAATKESLAFRFGYYQGTSWNGYDRASTVQDYEATATVASEVWDVLASAHTEAGSFGLLLSEIAGTSFSSATDSLHALKLRLDSVDTALGTIDTEVGAIQSDVTSIKAKTDNLPADTATVLSGIGTNVSDVEAAIGTPLAIDGSDATVAAMLRKLFDDGTGFDATTDSLRALRAALDAKPTYPTSFAGTKATASLAQSGAETLEYSTGEGVLTNNCTLFQLKVTVTGACTNATVQIYEKTGSANLVYEIQNVDATGLNLALVPGLIFRNADVSVTNKVYVKITNVADAGSSSFSVELRGLLNSN